MRPKPGPGHADYDRRELLGALGALSGLWALTGARSSSASLPAQALAPASGSELWSSSALELASAIARREVSSLEVVEAHLARIEAVNPAVNAVVRSLAEQARVAARAADQALGRGDELGPFHGVPFTIKENIELAGTPTTQGVPALAGRNASHDAIVVERMKAAGAVPIGRTNLPDLALRVHTFSSLHGRTLNPWHPDRNVGGSSGGDAAALATGMTPLGLGNDIGGSLRNPSYCCATVALKPTLGRIPSAVSQLAPSSIGSQLMAVQGPMARRIADLRVGYRVLAGPHPADPWSVPVPLEGPPLDGPRRVALVPEPSGGTTDPTVAAGVRRAGAALADAGFEVEEIEPPELPRVAAVWGHLIATELAAALPQLRMLMGEEALLFLEPGLEYLQPLGFAAYSELLGERLQRAAQWSEFQSRYPLIVGPVFTAPPFPVGHDLTAEGAIDTLVQLRLTVAINILGIPAVAVPVGVEGGLPQGVQVIGDRYREELCLDAAEAIEEALGTFTPIDPQTA